MLGWVPGGSMTDEIREVWTQIMELVYLIFRLFLHLKTICKQSQV